MRIDERVTVPLFWLFIAAPTFIGAVGWLTFIAYSSNAHAERLNKLEQKVEDRYEILLTIREDVAIIKDKVLNQKEKRK